MMKLSLYYSGYYTHFSFLLFIISFTLPFTSYLKTFILYNSIIVGIAGNFISIKDHDAFSDWIKERHPEKTQEQINYELSMANLIFHTIPMVISFILLLYCTRFIYSYSDAIVFFLLELIVFLLWSLFPYQNQIVQQKISSSYPSTSFAITFTYICSAILFLLMAYLSK
jgi:hypothetical protein